MWLGFALMTPLFWAIVHVVDSRCVEDIFEKPWMGAITSALASLVVITPLPIILPFVEWHFPGWEIIGLALLAGCLIQASQFFYFQALKFSESGIVAAYWNLTPALLPVVTYIVTQRILSLPKYLGISILIIASVGMCLADSNIQTRWKSFFLMLIASFLQVIFFIIEDYIFELIPFLQGFYLITLGLIIAGALPLLHPSVWSLFRKNSQILTQSAYVFVSIEIINLCALFTTQKAVDLGIPSLVAAVESTIPAYTFLLSLFLLKFSPRLGDPDSANFITSKLLLVSMMVVGVYFVA